MKKTTKSQKQLASEFKADRCVVIKMYLMVNDETSQDAKDKAVKLINETVFKSGRIDRILGTQAYQIHFCGQKAVRLDPKKAMMFDCACPADERP